MHGLMPCGTTGETALLEADEVIAVVETVVEAARGRVPVVAHVGRPSTNGDGQADRARHRRRRAGRLGDRPLLLRLRRPRDHRPLPRAAEGGRTARRCSPTTSRPAPATTSAPRCSPRSSPRASPGSRTPPGSIERQEALPRRRARRPDLRRLAVADARRAAHGRTRQRGRARQPAPRPDRRAGARRGSTADDDEAERLQEEIAELDAAAASRARRSSRSRPTSPRRWPRAARATPRRCAARSAPDAARRRWTATPTAKSPRPIAIHSGSR